MGECVRIFNYTTGTRKCSILQTPTHTHATHKQTHALLFTLKTEQFYMHIYAYNHVVIVVKKFVYASGYCALRIVPVVVHVHVHVLVLCLLLDCESC